jgi:hypothetical protein
MDNGSSARIAAPVLLVAGPVLRCEAFNTGNTAFVSFQGVSTATNYIFTGLRTGTQVLSGFNGGGLASTSTAGTPNSGNSLAAIGSNTVGTNLLNGVVGEIIFCRVAPGQSEQQKVEGYLAWKWNLVSGLPSTHPFKHSPP